MACFSSQKTWINANSKLIAKATMTVFKRCSLQALLAAAAVKAQTLFSSVGAKPAPEP